MEQLDENICCCKLTRVLPLVFDDTLSYYEFLCKVTTVVNEAVDVVEANDSALRGLQTVVNVLTPESMPSVSISGGTGEDDPFVLTFGLPASNVQSILPRIVALESALSGIQTTITGIQADLGDVLADVADAKYDIRLIKIQDATQNNRITIVEAKANSAEQAVEAIEEAVEEIADDVTALTSTVGQHTTQITALNGDVESLGTRMTAAEQAIEEIEAGGVKVIVINWDGESDPTFDDESMDYDGLKAILQDEPVVFLLIHDDGGDEYRYFSAAVFDDSLVDGEVDAVFVVNPNFGYQISIFTGGMAMTDYELPTLPLSVQYLRATTGDSGKVLTVSATGKPFWNTLPTPAEYKVRDVTFTQSYNVTTHQYEWACDWTWNDIQTYLDNGYHFNGVCIDNEGIHFSSTYSNWDEQQEGLGFSFYFYQPFASNPIELTLWEDDSVSVRYGA